MIRFILLALFVLLPSYVFADKIVYETKYTDGALPIVLDGNLNDWKSLGTSQEPFTYYVALSKDEVPTPMDLPPASDISGWMMCAADKAGVYMAIHVTDDVVVTDNQGFPNGWKDDIAEICFDGDLVNVEKTKLDANDGQISVAGGKNGLRWMGGFIPGLMAQIPYYWEARGVRAGYKQTDGGYNIEIMIPLAILGYDFITGGTKIGMNVRIMDNDDAAAGADGMPKGILTWAYDPKIIGSSHTEINNQVLFSTKIDASEIAASADTTAIVSLSENELLVNVGITEANRSETEKVMKTVSQKLSDRNWDGADEALSPVKDQIWAKCITGYLSLNRRDYKNGVKVIDDFGKSCGDKAVAEWSKNCAAEYAYFGGANKADCAYLLHEYLKLNPSDSIAFREFMYSLITITVNAECDGVSLDLLEKLSHEATTQSVADIEKLALARAYFIGNKYDLAKNVANELIASCSNSKIVFNAIMVLMSIDMKVK